MAALFCKAKMNGAVRLPNRLDKPKKVHAEMVTAVKASATEGKNVEVGKMYVCPALSWNS